MIPNYNDPNWKIVRKIVLARAGNKCELCGDTVENVSDLDLHHLHYNSIGRETPKDVLMLCSKCHIIADNERRLSGKIMTKKQFINYYGYENYPDELIKNIFADYINLLYCLRIKGTHG